MNPLGNAGGHSESGFSLIEMLIAIAILSVAVVTIVGGIGVAIFASDHHRKEADASSVLFSAAEAVKASNTSWIECASAAPVPAPGYQAATGYLTAARSVPLPAGWSAAQITIPEFDPTDAQTDPPHPLRHGIQYWDGADFGNVCFPSSPGLPLALQRIWLEVKTTDGRVTERVSVVKRCSPPTTTTTTAPDWCGP